jgi:hypothetical protein
MQLNCSLKAVTTTSSSPVHLSSLRTSRALRLHCSLKYVWLSPNLFSLPELSENGPFPLLVVHSIHEDSCLNSGITPYFLRLSGHTLLDCCAWGMGFREANCKYRSGLHWPRPESIRRPSNTTSFPTYQGPSRFTRMLPAPVGISGSMPSGYQLNIRMMRRHVLTLPMIVNQRDLCIL